MRKSVLWRRGRVWGDRASRQALWGAVEPGGEETSPASFLSDLLALTKSFLELESFLFFQFSLPAPSMSIPTIIIIRLLSWPTYPQRRL